MKITCNWCGKSWTGKTREHCTASHETFNSTAAGDMHRRGDFPNRRCDATGMIYDEQRGVWITERMPNDTHHKPGAA